MRTDPGFDRVLDSNREHHLQNLLTQHLGGPPCGYNTRESLLSE